MTTGSRNSLVNMEARPLDAKMVTRRCIVTRLKEMTGAKYRELIEQKAGGLIILLPLNLSSLCPEDKQVCSGPQVSWFSFITEFQIIFTVVSVFTKENFKPFSNLISPSSIGTHEIQWLFSIFLTHNWSPI